MEECMNDIIARNWLDLYTYRSNPIRIYFILVQDPFWVYLDYGRSKYHVSELNESEFCLAILKRCEFLSQHIQKFEETFSEFSRYRRMVPTYGAILLNKDIDKVVLVSSYKYGHRGFPKGKINEGETEIECAIREVYEEVGIDITNSINDKEYLFIEGVDEKYLKLFVIASLDESIQMKPTVSYEIGEVKFYPISELENHCQKKDKVLKQVQQFLGPISKWIRKKKKTRIFL